MNELEKMNLKNMQIFRQISPDKRFDIGFLCLIQGLIIISYFDFLRDQANIWVSLLIPVFSYLIGAYISRTRELSYALVGVSTIALIVNMLHGTTDKGILVGLLIPAVSLVFSLVESKIKIAKWLIAALDIVAILLILVVRKSLQIRIAAIMQAIILVKKNEFGGVIFDVMPGNTSSTMWLDYARDYGLFPLVMLGMFAIVTVIVLIKLIIRNDKSFTAYLLVNLYIFINAYYLLYSTARYHISLWAIGLMVCGMMWGIIKEDK